ncbi:M20/M25/M40 family metallo-hydrolase, partial [Klebsiella pneumoniae]
YSFKVERGEPALNNSAAINDWIIEAIEEMYPQLSITRRPFGMGGEDFGYVTQKLPGSMIFLGCALKDEVQRDLHTPIFDIDETCLPIGVA